MFLTRCCTSAPYPSRQYQSAPSSPLHQSAQEKRVKSLAMSNGPTLRCTRSVHSPASATTDAGLTSLWAAPALPMARRAAS